MKRGRVFAGVVLVLLMALPAFGFEGVNVSGITEAINDVTLSSDVTGQIAALHVKEGARVKKGEVLLELDHRIESLEVRRRKLIWESKVELESARERAAILKLLLDTNRSLYEKTRSVSEEELRKIELDYKTALAESKRLEIAEKQEKIEYEIARETLEKRILRSPVDGIVVRLFLDKGEHCKSREPLVRVADTRRCLFVGNVKEGMGRALKADRKVRLKIGAGDAFMEKEGRIVYVSPVVDPASGLLEVKASFDNGDEAVKPGVSGQLSLMEN